MKKTKVYQTVNDLDNADYIESVGPFKCNRKDAWLGDGYYFWETFIENAHWWGETRKDYKSYVITQAHIDLNENCLDLVGDTSNLLAIEKAAEKIKEIKGPSTEILVPTIIEFLRTSGIFKFTSVRANGINSKSEHYSDDNFRFKFDKKYGAYLEYKPIIQICLYNLSEYNFQNYSIVYPEHYI